MSLINVRDKTIQAKIVYYGTALSGKTTSLQHVHKVIDPEGRVELVSLNTEGDRTFFFDFLPIPLGSVNGYQLKFQAFTVPGQVKYNLTRRYVLRGADAVIFVADSAPGALEENLRALEGLAENLAANGFDPEKVPLLLQYNKRDLPGALPVEQLRASLNPRAVPEFETIATTGPGVFEAFSEICASVTEGLAREYRVGDPGAARSAVARRLQATHLTWKRTAADDGGTRSGDSASTAGLASVEGENAAAVIEVSSKDVPDLPDAETLLRHAVDTNIESARLLSELTETRRRLADHVRHLAALHQTGVALSSELDGERLLDHVLLSAIRTVDAEQGAVLFLVDGTTCLEQRVAHGLVLDPLVDRAGTDPTIVQRILTKKPFILEIDAAGDVVTGEDTCPMVALVAPLVQKGQVLGALTAYSLDRPMDQDVRQRLRFLQAVASQAAVAIVNSRLYARIESFNRDLERKVAERTHELARALEELKQLDRLKDDFLASMSHELLTPLQSLGSAGEILAALAADEGPKASDDRREFAHVVQREAARLASILRAVLDLREIEAGKVEFRREPLCLRDAVLASHQRLRSEFKAARSRLKVRVEEAIRDADADPLWVGRVLDALLANAVKFGAAGAEVSVTIRSDGRGVKVEVRDEGPGVPEPLRMSIFEKFKQVGDVLTEKPPGLGLGLPTARLLVQRMGGRIWYDPAKPTGSIFSFSLPGVGAPVRV